MNRRGFLGAILAAGVAPAFVGSSILMPVRRILSSLNTLDDYEVGTFEPTFQFGNERAVGTYTRIGNMVYLSMPSENSLLIAEVRKAGVILPQYTAAIRSAGQ